MRTIKEGDCLFLLCPKWCHCTLRPSSQLTKLNEKVSEDCEAHTSDHSLGLVSSTTPHGRQTSPLRDYGGPLRRLLGAPGPPSRRRTVKGRPPGARKENWGGRKSTPWTPRLSDPLNRVLRTSFGPLGHRGCDVRVRGMVTAPVTPPAVRTRSRSVRCTDEVSGRPIWTERFVTGTSCSGTDTLPLPLPSVGVRSPRRYGHDHVSRGL